MRRLMQSAAVSTLSSVTAAAGLALLGLLLFASVASAQTGIITTVAGGGPNNIPALQANLAFPEGVASDSSRNLYISSPEQHRVFKIDGSGQMTVLAGLGTRGLGGFGGGGFGGDGGPATSASLAMPRGVAVDGVGNVFIADEGNRRVRKVDAAGVITTVAGNGDFGTSGDGGPAIDAGVGDPYGLAVDGAGNLYIADANNHRIRKVDAEGTITTVAGGGCCWSVFNPVGDGDLATKAGLAFPSGVAVDGAGNLYIADRFHNRIRKVNTRGVITTVAGNGNGGFSGDGGAATSANLRNPTSVAVDSGGNLYIADSQNNRVRKVDASGVMTTLAGSGSAGFAGDGDAARSAKLAGPFAVTIDAVGNLIISDSGNHRIRKVDAA